MAVRSRPPARTWLLGQEVLGAFLLVVGLVAVATVVQMQFLQIPGYLLIVGSDLIQNPLLPGLTGWGYAVFFAVYLYGVAVVIGTLYRWWRSVQSRD